MVAYPDELRRTQRLPNTPPPPVADPGPVEVFYIPDQEVVVVLVLLPSCRPVIQRVGLELMVSTMDRVVAAGSEEAEPELGIRIASAEVVVVVNLIIHLNAVSTFTTAAE